MGNIESQIKIIESKDFRKKGIVTFSSLPEYSKWMYSGEKDSIYIIPQTSEEVSELSKEMLDITPLERHRRHYPLPTQFTKSFVLANHDEMVKVNTLFVLHNVWADSVPERYIIHGAKRFFDCIKRMDGLDLVLTTPTSKWAHLESSGCFRKVAEKDGYCIFAYYLTEKADPKAVKDFYKQIGSIGADFFRHNLCGLTQYKRYSQGINTLY